MSTIQLAENWTPETVVEALAQLPDYEQRDVLCSLSCPLIVRPQH